MLISIHAHDHSTHAVQYSSSPTAPLYLGVISFHRVPPVTRVPGPHRRLNVPQRCAWTKVSTLRSRGTHNQSLHASYSILGIKPMKRQDQQLPSTNPTPPTRWATFASPLHRVHARCPHGQDDDDKRGSALLALARLPRP